MQNIHFQVLELQLAGKVALFISSEVFRWMYDPLVFRNEDIIDMLNIFATSPSSALAKTLTLTLKSPRLAQINRVYLEGIPIFRRLNASPAERKHGKTFFRNIQYDLWDTIKRISGMV